MSFSGSVAEIYDRHLTRPLFDPFAKMLAKGLPECSDVLELACGTGICTRRLAHAVQVGTSVIAFDQSESMVSLAARKVFADGPIGWLRANAEVLPFCDNAFDVAICSFGLMFFEDKLAALKEIHRVLLPGGLFRCTVWASADQNPWIAVVKSVLAGAFPDCNPTWYDAPFQSANVESNLALMQTAGFSEVRLTPVRLPLRDGDPASLARGFVQGNPAIRNLIVERKVCLADLEQTLADAFASEFGRPVKSTMRGFFFETGVIE